METFEKQMETFEKQMETFWEKMETFEKKMEHFEKKSGAKKNLVEPFVKNPTDLDPLFARQSKQKKGEISSTLGFTRTLGPTILQV